jgi:hypothetical protein
VSGFDREKVSLSVDTSQLGPGSYRLWVDGASRTFTVR